MLSGALLLPVLSSSVLCVFVCSLIDTNDQGPEEDTILSQEVLCKSMAVFCQNLFCTCCMSIHSYQLSCTICVFPLC